MRRVGGAVGEFALVLLLAARVAGASAPISAAWSRAPHLVDARLAQSRDVSVAALADGALVLLPTPIILSGRAYSSVRIGIGTLALMSGQEPRFSADGTQPLADGGSGLRVDVLAGDGVTLGPRGSVLVAGAADGVVIRWTELVLPDGQTATVEAMTDVTGALTVQYLRVPRVLPFVKASAGLLPASATAFRLEGTRLPRAPRVTSTDPLPSSCTSVAGTWCDQADGPGTMMFWLDEKFDDGGGASRGWTAPGNGNIWHEIDFATCPPGASTNPGRAWYAGDSASCAYPARRTDALLSPLIGPLTAGARLTFTSRIAKDEPRDRADVLVNGITIASYASLADPFGWGSATPLDLSAFAGQSVQIEFRFTSDNSGQDIGWFVDDVKLYDTTSANLACRNNAGVGGMTPCSNRVSTRWDFNESAYCQGCTYTFYALVECGREMHLPLDDMEGADVSITNVVTGAPVSLRCANQTARAQAGLGSYPYIAPLTQDCCAVPVGAERWYGPPFDETDTAGAGRVAWGMPTCTSLFDAYDTNADNAIACSELGTCGGELSALSPGEYQVMDCSIADDSGLCGLYRVDVTSGGFAWSLFANCDGTNTPQFPLFFDCADAWAAYSPLPELAVANLSTAGACPGLSVSFDLVNLGCKDHPGPTTLRIVSDCTPADSQDYVIPDIIPANGRVSVTGLAFNASCSPVRVEVQVDSGNIVAECTESPTAAACRAVPGVDALATFACGCAAAVNADAGGDIAACLGARVILSGAGSSIAGCAQLLYRWTDPSGAIALDWSVDPNADLGDLTWAEAGTWHLDVACSVGGNCSGSADVNVQVVDVAADAGPDLSACEGVPVPITGAGVVVMNCSTVIHEWLDDTETPLTGPLTDPSVVVSGITGCPATVTLLLRSTCGDAGMSGCSSIDVMTISCAAPPGALAPSVLPGCPGMATQFDCRAALTSTIVAWAWDLDSTWDSDGNGVSDDDVDASACAASASYPAGAHAVRLTGWDVTSCAVTAGVPFTVAPDAPPADVVDDRFTRAGSALIITWAPTPLAASYRVERGTLRSLWIARTYDHATESVPGEGACDAGNVGTWTDPDDAARLGTFYYLVTAVSTCGIEGPPGEGWDGRVNFPRMPRTPSAGCL